MDVKPDTRFWVIVANFKSVPVRMDRNDVVGIMLPSPRVILEVHNWEEDRDSYKNAGETRDGEE